MTFCNKTFASSPKTPNNKPNKLLIAGATSIPGLQEVTQAFAINGIQVDFIEAPFMKAYLKQQTDNTFRTTNANTDNASTKNQPCITYTDNPAPDIPVIPLSEYWISFCLQTSRCRIAQRALEASRSKKYFYSLMTSAGFEAVHCFASEQDAINYLKSDVQNSYQYELASNSSTRKVLVKPDGLNSGLGIEIVTSDNVDLLGKYIDEAQNIKTKNLQLTGVLKNNTQISCLITEYIEGTEYSADCFYFLGQVVIVRVCRKRIAFINNRPCTLVYQLITPPKEIETQLIRWTSALFDENDISFAQFDFIIEQGTNRIVPIDFAARIGGGMYELMSFTKPNCYAKAIQLALTARISSNIQKTGASDNPDTDNHTNNRASQNSDNCASQKPENPIQPILTQLNYLSSVKGHIINDNYKLASGVQYVFKHKGDYVTSLPSSVGSRIALVIQQNNNENLPSNIEESLLLGDDWIM